MSDFVLQARGLACGVGTKRVLDNIELQIRPGERVVLLGPNGSGKSTLLATLSGLRRPLAGEVMLGDRPLAGLRPNEIAQRVGVVPQEELPRFSFSVREIVTMGRLARSNGLVDTPEDREIATEAMHEADCLVLADRPVTELSGGERQRVLIARALAQETPLLLLDEPTSHLDPSHQIAVAKIVAKLAKRGIATIAAVHDLNLASRLADRAILLEDGGIAKDDAVEKVLESSILDRVYGVSFLRYYFPAGGVALAPLDEAGAEAED